MYRSISFIVVALLFNCSCQLEAPLHKKPFVQVKGMSFVDSLGREIVFHGLNMVNKDEENAFRGKESEVDFEKMKSWGMNCVRLGVSWAALEPQPGEYDTTYLTHLDKYIAWAQGNGIYVLLDMHQDLYGVPFGNGAPEWAVLDEDLPHIAPGAVWSDAYFTSPAVKTAFDNFWADKPASDGVGVQSHLVNAWQAVAKRYADEPTVIGFDLMNEPFIGSKIDTVQQLYLREMAKIYAKESGESKLSLHALMQKWASPDGRAEIMKKLADTALFKQVIDATEPVYARFEREKLMPYYRAAHKAIRKVDTNHIIFMEPSVSANAGVYSHLEKLTFANGNVDPQQAYAPHAYDLVTDTENAGDASFGRLALIYSRHHQKQKELNLPMLVGEWGAFYAAGKEVLPVAQFSARQQEQFACGDMYWSYFRNLSEMAYFKALNRPYPAYIPGKLISYNYSTQDSLLTIKWQNINNKASMLIYLPTVNFKLTGKAAKEVTYDAQQGNSGGTGVWLSLKTDVDQSPQSLGIRLLP